MPLSNSAKFLFEDMIWAIEERNVFESDKVKSLCGSYPRGEIRNGGSPHSFQATS